MKANQYKGKVVGLKLIPGQTITYKSFDGTEVTEEMGEVLLSVASPVHQGHDFIRIELPVTDAAQFLLGTNITVSLTLEEG